MPPSSSTTVREFLRTTTALRVNETRSVLLTLSCRAIVDGTYCFCKSRLVSNLSFQCANCLLKLCDNLSSSKFQIRQTEQFVDFVFNFRQMLLLRFTRADSTNTRVPANFTVSFACPPGVPAAELPRPAVHHNNKIRATMTKLCVFLSHSCGVRVSD